MPDRCRRGGPPGAARRAQSGARTVRPCARDRTEAGTDGTEQKRTRLQEDPLFARECLRRGGAGVDAYLHALDPLGCCAMEMLKASESDPLPQEGEVLLTIARELQDVLIQPGFRQEPRPDRPPKKRSSGSSPATALRRTGRSMSWTPATARDPACDERAIPSTRTG